MTEAEWMACTDPKPMLEFVRAKASERKLRLFAVACCRRIWPLLTDEQSRTAVEIAERYADATTSEQELSAIAIAIGTNASFDPDNATVRAAEASIWLDPHSTSHYSAFAASCDSTRRRRTRAGQHRFLSMNEARNAERLVHCNLLRDLFGFLAFRPFALAPSWLSWHDCLLVSMAQKMYDSRDFTDMPVLADALEEAGCQDQFILGHCRSAGEHVRGCWLVDALLGKE
ncbi:MAG TPA: hypothetical protein VH643_07825 [Gemmataceae bacterium]